MFYWSISNSALDIMYSVLISSDHFQKILILNTGYSEINPREKNSFISLHFNYPITIYIRCIC